MSARCRPPCPRSARTSAPACARPAGCCRSSTWSTALGGMAIALTADRFGHRRLIVLGTALCFAASLLGALRRQHRPAAGLALPRGPGLHHRHGRRSRPLRAAHRRRRATAHRAMTIWTTYMPAGAGVDDADRGRHPAGHVVARGLAGGGGRFAAHAAGAAAARRAAARARCPAAPIAGRSCPRWPRSRPAAGRSRSPSASAPIPAAGSPSWASCRPCRSSAWASRPRPPRSSRRW